jgi:hypothetical protein
LTRPAHFSPFHSPLLKIQLTDRIAAARIWRPSPQAVPARPLRFCGVRYIDGLFAVRASVLEEEADHFAAGVGTVWLGVRSIGAPA